MPTLVNNLRAIRGPVTAVPVSAGSGIEISADTQNNQIVISSNLEAGSGIEIVDDNGKAKIINSDNAQALPIVAGTGVKLSVVNNQVVVSADETVLWEGDYTNSGSIALSESYRNFSVMAVYFKDNNNNTSVQFVDTANQQGTMILVAYSFGTLSSQVQLWIKPANYTLANTSITYVEDNEFNLYAGSVRVNGAGQRIHILKVVGINRLSN